MDRPEGFIGECRAMRRMFLTIEKAAIMNMPVLIEGETGTGKEMVARAIHALSPRAHGPFVAVNTGAMAPELVQSALFGHVAGAFTGANDGAGGCFSEAHGGTLLLDETSLMDERVQVSLLRVLESGTFRPVGGTADKTSDARILAATNVPLAHAVAEGHFRADLMYRLSVLRISVPPLRKRKSDILLLANAFIAEVREHHKLAIDGISPEALNQLLDYRWPGNVRQLKNVISQACVAAGSGTIRVEHLPAKVRKAVGNRMEPSTSNATVEERDEVRKFDGHSFPMNDAAFLPLGSSLEEIRRIFVMSTIEHFGNNKTQAADSLGISRKGLYDMLARWSGVDEAGSGKSRSAKCRH